MFIRVRLDGSRGVGLGRPLGPSHDQHMLVEPGDGVIDWFGIDPIVDAGKAGQCVRHLVNPARPVFNPHVELGESKTPARQPT